MNFKPEADLIGAISLDNISDVRRVLIEYIRKAPEKTKEILNALNYAKELGDELFETHDGKALKNISDWSEEYFTEQLEELNHNFSEQRFNHLCLVGAHIYSSDNQDTIIINNTEPVSDMEVQVEKLKAGITLGLGLLVGFLVGKKRK